MAMQCNVGGADKTARIMAGSGLAAFALLADVNRSWKTLASVAAAISLTTATVGYCPINSLLGINSCETAR